MPFCPFFCPKHLTYTSSIWDWILVISLDGWWIGQWNLYRCSSRVFSIVSTKFHLDRERRFYTNLVWKSWCFWVFADISARSESENKTLECFVYLFFGNVQCCVRVSASNFQVLTRESGGARAFGNIVRFLAGPARSVFYIVRIASHQTQHEQRSHAHSSRTGTRTSWARHKNV